MEPTGWKLVHGDVLRAPPHSTWSGGAGHYILFLRLAFYLKFVFSFVDCLPESLLIPHPSSLIPTPPCPRLVTLVGTGVQLLCMLLVTLVVACLGMLSPGVCC